jgi:hypothetical protein
MADFHIDAKADPTPGSRGYLKWYWCYGPGRKKWFHDTKGYWPGSRGGSNPIGPG